MPPNNVPDVHRMDQALRAAPKGVEMILMGDLNVRLGDPCDECEEDLVTALVERGLVNMTYHFMPQRRYRGAGRWTFCMHWEG